MDWKRHASVLFVRAVALARRRYIKKLRGLYIDWGMLESRGISRPAGRGVGDIAGDRITMDLTLTRAVIVGAFGRGVARE